MATTTIASIVASEGDLSSFTRSDDKYAVLNVAKHATFDDIKRAYRKLALLYHPDRHASGAKPRAEEIFKRITAAYQTLSDPAARAEYDRLVARGHAPDLASEARHQQIDPLEQILADILRYKHIFDGALRNTPGDLHGPVLGSLIVGDVREGGSGKQRKSAKEGTPLFEEIVGDMPLKQAPAGVFHQGNFTRGAVVLTNIRLLLAFESQLIETSGNTQTTYSWYNVRGAAFPAMQSVTIDRTDRIRNRFSVGVDAGSDSLAFVPKFGQLGKLLLLCSLWGIPVIPRESYSRREEMKRVFLRRPLRGVLAVAIFFAVVSVCSDEELARSEAAVIFFQVAFVPWALAIVWGLVEVYRAYWRPGIDDLLRASDSDD